MRRDVGAEIGGASVGVERRQMELKGVIGSEIESEGWALRDDGKSP
jgi:hypothetical protein